MENSQGGRRERKEERGEKKSDHTEPPIGVRKHAQRLEYYSPVILEVTSHQAGGLLPGEAHRALSPDSCLSGMSSFHTL